MIRILTYYHLEATAVATSISQSIGGYPLICDTIIHSSELSQFDLIDNSIPLHQISFFNAICVLNSDDEVIARIGYFKKI